MAITSQEIGNDPKFSDRWQSSVFPGLLILYGVKHFFLSVLSKILNFNLQDLLDLQALRNESFGRLWTECGAILSHEMPEPLYPLMKNIRGVVLDVGPGSGEQLHLFPAENIEMVYGVEPTVSLHAELLRNAEKAGLGNKYRILAAGAQKESLIPALAKEGLLEGGNGEVFDAIACIRVLCGVPNVQDTTSTLYSLLKPGGKMIVCEHVVNNRSIFARAMQWFWMKICRWSFWMGDCRLDQDTEQVLKKAAGKEGWEEEKYWGIARSWHVVPNLVADLVKRG